MSKSIKLAKSMMIWTKSPSSSPQSYESNKLKSELKISNPLFFNVLSAIWIASGNTLLINSVLPRSFKALLYLSIVAWFLKSKVEFWLSKI